MWLIHKPIFIFRVIVINSYNSTFEIHIKNQTNKHSPFWHNARLSVENEPSGSRHGVVCVMRTSLLMCMVVSGVVHQSSLSASIPLIVSFTQFHSSRSGCRYIPTYTSQLQMETKKSFMVIILGMHHVSWAQPKKAHYIR